MTRIMPVGESLSFDAKLILLRKFGCEIQFLETTTPEDSSQHVANCHKIDPTFCLLPEDYDPKSSSIHKTAAHQGFLHLKLSPGSVHEILVLRPEHGFEAIQN